MPAEDEQWASDQQLQDVLDRAALATTLGSLSDSDRTLLRMHYELDMSVTSLARALDVPEGAVKVRLHRARGRLRTDLERARAASSDSG